MSDSPHTADIVERVRDAILKATFNSDPQWLTMATSAAEAAIAATRAPDHEAAAEIKALRERELKLLRDIEALVVERHALRAALKDHRKVQS